MYSIIIILSVLSLVGAAPKLTRSPVVQFNQGREMITSSTSRPFSPEWDQRTRQLVRQDAVIAESQGNYPPLEDFWTKDFGPKDHRGTTTVVPWGKRKFTKSEITFLTLVIASFYEHKQVCSTMDVHATNPSWGLTDDQTAVVKSKAALTSAVWTAGTVFAVSKCWLLPHPIYAIPCSYYVGMKGSEWTRSITNKVACSEYKKQSGKDECPVIEASLNHSERTALALKIAEMKIEEQSAKIADLEMKLKKYN